MKGYSDFFNNLELNKEDLKLFIENNELNQIKLFINSLTPGDILYDYEKILRQLCKLPERKVQKGDINLVKRQDGIIQLGRTNGKYIKGRKNSLGWRKLCLFCEKYQAHYSNKHGDKNVYCSNCSRKKGYYQKQNPCKSCKKVQANFSDEDGNKNTYCSKCAKKKGSYQKKRSCKRCEVKQATYPNEYGKERQYCSDCSRKKGCYKKQNLCKSCNNFQASYFDEHGNKNIYCSECAKKKGSYQIQRACRICKKASASYQNENGEKKKYCATCARLKNCYQIRNPCKKCNEIQASITCGHVVKNDDGTYTTTKLKLCVGCAIKLKLYDPTKNRNKSEKRFRKEMRMFVKEQEENKYINLDFENTMFTNCIDNEEICRNKFSLRLDGLLQYRGIYWLLENDEHQHSYRGYYPLSCELDRMMKAINLIRLQGVIEPVVFIRFNPDTCHHNQETIRIPKTQRFQKLKELLRTYTPTKDFEIHYMYYDTLEDNLELQSEPHWINTLNRFVKIHQ